MEMAINMLNQSNSTNSDDEIACYLSLSEEEILRRLDDLEAFGAEDWIVSVEPGDIDLKEIEKINEVLERLHGQRIEIPKTAEEKAIERIESVNDDTQWITLPSSRKKITTEEIRAHKKKRGYS